MGDMEQSTVVFADEARIKRMRKAELECVVEDCNTKMNERAVERCKNESFFMAERIGEVFREGFAVGFAESFAATSYRYFNISQRQLEREVLFVMVKKDVLPLYRAAEKMEQSEDEFSGDMYEWLFSTAPEIATFDDALKAIDYIAFSYAEGVEKQRHFEHLIRAWLKASPEWQGVLSDVWLWDDEASPFPAREEFGDLRAIDIVAHDAHGGYQAIGCHLCCDHERLYAGGIAHFLAASAKMFFDPQVGKQVCFSNRLYIAATNHVMEDAECLAENQVLPFRIVTRADLESSSVDWQKLFCEVFTPLGKR